jgi:hypothetical protein
MKKHLKVLLVFIIACSLFSQVSAQVNKPKETPKKTTTKQKPPAPKKKQESVIVQDEEVVEEPPPPPPPGQEWLTDSTSVEMSPALDSNILKSLPQPMKDFDTTAVTNDPFTKDILQLLNVTNALGLGLTMAEGLKSEEIESNPMLKAFYAKLIEDMRSGTARRWFERTFVREYRKFFTHEDIKGLLAFYETSLGRKVVRSTHEMLPGCMDAGRKIGAYIGFIMMMEMMKEERN